MLPIQLNERQGTLLTTLLVLGTIVLAAAVIFIAANVFYAFGDIDPDLLPRLAARVHPQPDRHPADERDPGPAAGRRDDPRLRGAVRGHRPHRHRPRRRAGDVDLGVHRRAFRRSASSCRSCSPRGRRRSTAFGLPGQPRGPGRRHPERRRQLRRPARRPGPAARGREHRRDGLAAARADPVALHGRRPRPDLDVPVPLVPPVPPVGGAAARAERRRARSAGSSAARRSSASSTRPSRSSRAPCSTSTTSA